jgi:osmotically-inducible protein OsmY
MTIVTKPDAQIQLDVLKEMKWDTRVDETDVGVEVDRGIVTLTGTVSSYAARMAAQQAAHRVYGVLDVANDIHVRLPGSPIRTDTDIAEDVRRALDHDVLVPSDRIRTTVSNGLVTLEGEVDLWREREDAEYAVRNLVGVVGVVNQIAVAPPRVGAEDIRNAIEQALERQATREADRIKIRVQDGTVTVGGEVRSWREKRAVLGTAGHAPGVRHIIDRLVIAPYT